MWKLERLIDPSLNERAHDPDHLRQQVRAGLFYELAESLREPLAAGPVCVKLTLTEQVWNIGTLIQLRVESLDDPLNELAHLREQLQARELIIRRLHRELEGALRE